MSNVNGVGTLSGVGFTNMAAEAGALTPDALMEFCQAQLSSIDHSADALMDQQNQSAQASSALSNAASLLNAHSDGWQTNGKDPGSNPGHDALPQDQADGVYNGIMEQLTAAETADPSLATTIDSIKGTLTTTYEADGNVSQTEVSQLQDQIKDASSDASTNQQMGMIQLQSLMSQRQQAIQMASNMIQTLNDSSKSVITNINQ